MTMIAMPPAQALASPQDKAEISTLVESVATLADRRNFTDLEQLYDDEVTVDYMSLVGGEAKLKSPQALMSQWAAVLPGFDMTRHDISKIKVTVNGRRAVATADVKADHYLDDHRWQVRGNYRYELEQEGDTWQIISHTFNLQHEKGDRNILSTAAERAKVINTGGNVDMTEVKDFSYSMIHATAQYSQNT